MDLTPYLHAKGERILKGVTGVIHQGKGTISLARAPIVGVDWNLIRLQMLVVDQLRIAMRLNSTDGGGHVQGSRHFDGRADDCSLMGPVGGPLMPATLLNRAAVRYVEFLLSHGVRVGEGGPWAGVLLGPPGTRWNNSRVGHVTHVHTSIFRRPVPGTSEEWVEEEDSCGEEGENKSLTGEGERREIERKKELENYLSAPLVASASLRAAFPPPFPPAKAPVLAMNFPEETLKGWMARVRHLCCRWRSHPQSFRNNPCPARTYSREGCECLESQVLKLIAVASGKRSSAARRMSAGNGWAARTTRGMDSSAGRGGGPEPIVLPMNMRWDRSLTGWLCCTPAIIPDASIPPTCGPAVNRKTSLTWTEKGDAATRREKKTRPLSSPRCKWNRSGASGRRAALSAASWPSGSESAGPPSSGLFKGSIGDEV